MDETPRRTWWRLHAMAWAYLLVGIGMWLVLNVPPTPQPGYLRNTGWPFRHGSTFQPRVLAANAAVGILCVSGMLLVFARNYDARRFRFGFKAIFALMLAAATWACLERRSLWIGPESLGIWVCYLGMACAWRMLFDVLGIAWNRLTSRRRATDGPVSEERTKKNFANRLRDANQRQRRCIP
jgi:hypothetical protein